MGRRERLLRVAEIGAALCYLGFWGSFALDRDGEVVPRWLALALLAVGAPGVFLSSRRARREEFGHDSRVPSWLAFTPLGKIVVVGLVASAVAAVAHLFGASWWSYAGLLVALVLWVVLPRDPLPDPLDRPARSDRPPFTP